MSRRWFGTDGIRGVANEELTPELALAVGRAAARVLGAGSGPRFLIGRDTRLSGGMLEAAVAAGITAAGGTVLLGGVIPTPAVSRLVSSEALAGGVVISASHNPFADNGIKLFGPDGQKLPDEVEHAVEEHMAALITAPDGSVDAGAEAPGTTAVPVGVVEPLEAAGPLYVEDLLATLSVDLTGIRVLLDCAHGATYRMAPLAFRAAGATVEAVAVAPDGVNINAECGSTHLGFVGAHVEQGDFDLGLAFDGDGDRVLAVDRAGRPVDGDQILVILAGWLRDQGRLAEDTVVVTSMSNLGLHRAMRARGIRVEVTDVGDRYVLERMLARGATLGGEQSGHILYLDAGATGDGIQTGLLLAHVLRQRGGSLADLAGLMDRFPQVLLNVRVHDKTRLSEASEIWEAVRAEEAALGEDGRVVLRPSGTESLVRVMVEAPTQERCDAVAGRLAGVVERALS